MEMEFMPEFAEVLSHDRDRKIIRGKRTKRQRPCSPFGDCLIENSTPDQSPVMSSEISTAEEDEDMANCLIMLAHSACVSPVNEENSKSEQIRQKTEKLSSRRFTEMTTTTTASGIGKSGFYVYECKTCNRTFPSFQALGGHRASHKKPKLNVEDKKPSSINIPPPPLTQYSEVDKKQHQQKAVVEDEENKVNLITVQKSPSRSPGFIQTGSIKNNSKSKIHECSICGSEFLSGQALGGHMRKHRPIPPTVNRTDGSSGCDLVLGKSPVGSSTTMLSLDLNLPPPEVVDDVQSKFQFAASSSQQCLVFSATPALVDCHY